MEKYLDTTKSVIISSPAGSGKTEKLARRYISLLLGGVEIEKILCITFTEKAAAEMKERILNILEKENAELFSKIKEKMPLMRISTIHSFCLKLLKRFSLELGLDPSLDVMDEFDSSLLWSEAVYECVMEEKNKPAIFFDAMKKKGIKGWDKLRSILNDLYCKRPLSELLLKTAASVEREVVIDSMQEEQKILELYSKCIERYANKKIERHLLDFDDLELMTYDALMKHPEWQNILYAFDEHTDHILVDEFQDTNSLQWKIIDKLTEEWRSGMGAKRNIGKTPTIFLVGDDKQSIYLFRGADAAVFQEAKDRLSEWLGKEYYFEEAKENFRSLPEIINFTNNLFEKLMPPMLHDNWKTKYAPFEATRQGKGRVELILIDSEENTKRNRAKEAAALAKRIRSLIGNYRIFDGENRRPCSYGDMAVLLRKRTHLGIFESALRNEQIPFIVVKGIGFYDEPEVSILRELLLFIIDPLDDYSLFCVLRSPLFSIDYETIMEIIEKDNRPLIEKLKDALPPHPLFAKGEQAEGNVDLTETFGVLDNWIQRAKDTPLAILLENALTETEGWRHYWEKQRHVNIKKFIKLIESYETSGFSNLEIREKLIMARDGDEPKANINTEGMNAVKIMTIHAAKGLQFPMVFLPSLEESDMPRSNAVVIDEEGGNISMAYEEDSTKRNKIIEFARRKEKEIEEGKRLFYVAVTRARDFLCMLGSLNPAKEPAGRLSYLTNNFDIIKNGKINKDTGLFEIITAGELDTMYSAVQPVPACPYPKAPLPAPIYTEPISFEPELKWRDVTEDIDIRITHGEEWVVIGIVFHRLFEELSKGILTADRIKERSLFLLKNEVLPEMGIERLNSIILGDFQGLEKSGYLNSIILPRENSLAEMPFILQKGKTVFRGRVDRIIIDKGYANIYDYKTFPVSEKELPVLKEKYRFQIDIYKEAAGSILGLKTKGYLLFTHNSLLVEI